MANTRPEPIARRQFLRGAGGVAIALPFLLSREGSTHAQAATARERLVTVYFALGMPAVLRQDGFSGALSPLAPFASKLTMVQGLNCNADSPNNGHSHGSAAFACGFGTTALSTKGGPSLDWVVHEATRTTTPLPTLSIGISSGDNADESVRYNHSWRGVDQPNLVILDTIELFQTIFGGQTLVPPSTSADPAAARQARRRVSVLDAVLADYRHVMSDAGGYSPSVRAFIAHHLETVRELEMRAVAIQTSFDQPSGKSTCASAPTPPAQMHSYLGPSAFGLDPKTTPYFDAMWSVMTDLYLLAMRCDLVRFGNLLVNSGGDSYAYTSSNGHTDDIHGDGYHRWSDPSVQPLVADNIQWQMSKVAEFLGKLDDPSYKDVDGASLLDNTTVVIGTELGDDVANHGLADMPFWIAGGRRRYQSGNFVIPGGRSDVELYNTLLRPIGVDSVFGDPAYFGDLLPILV